MLAGSFPIFSVIFVCVLAFVRNAIFMKQTFLWNLEQADVLHVNIVSFAYVIAQKR